MSFDFNKELGNLLNNEVNPNIANMQIKNVGKPTERMSDNERISQGQALEREIMTIANEIVLTKEDGVPTGEMLAKLPEDVRQKLYESEKAFADSVRASQGRFDSKYVDVRLAGGDGEREVIDSIAIDPKVVTNCRDAARDAGQIALDNLYDIEE